MGPLVDYWWVLVGVLVGLLVVLLVGPFVRLFVGIGGTISGTISGTILRLLMDIGGFIGVDWWDYWWGLVGLLMGIGGTIDGYWWGYWWQGLLVAGTLLVALLVGLSRDRWSAIIIGPQRTVRCRNIQSPLAIIGPPIWPTPWNI